jgi:lipopolysaccharide biosynthesis glycosyltransferase
MPSCCICYTTDPMYLFPTFVSAIQARTFSSLEKADVIIFCADLDNETEKVFGPLCARENIGLVSITRDIIEGQTAMLARLFLNRLVPDQYTHYLYLDGDVHIKASLDPLIDAEVPSGHFLAANDPITFLLADNRPQSRNLSEHLSSIGLTRGEALSYFNSGVLRINREGWDEIGFSAFEFSERNGSPSRFPDQDALNVVATKSRLPMSLAWNFPIFMRNSRVEANINPRILHFMSSPKPWNGSFPPWTDAACLPYTSALRTYPTLAPYSLAIPFRKHAVYHLQQRAKKISEHITWGFSERRDRILQYEADCAL